MFAHTFANMFICSHIKLAMCIFIATFKLIKNILLHVLVLIFRYLSTQ